MINRPTLVRVSGTIGSYEATYSISTDTSGTRFLWRLVRGFYPAVTTTAIIRDLLANPIGTAFTMSRADGHAVTLQSVA